MRIGTALALALALAGSTAAAAAPPGVFAPVAQTPSTPALSVPAATSGTPSRGLPTKKVDFKGATTANLNLRQDRNTGSKVLLTLPRGTVVTVTETVNGWSKTTYKNKTGWVSSRYFKRVAAVKAPTAKKPPAQKSPVKITSQKITTANLNLRQGTSTSSRSQLVIPRNSTITVAAASGTWSKTTYRNKTGWVSSKYLNNAPAPRAPSAPKASHRWTTANVHLRKGAGAKHASMGLVPFNERVTYLKSTSGWSNVKSSKGAGWISSDHLNASEQYAVSVYGTLRRGQSAYHVLQGRTMKETRTKLPSFNMYLKPRQTWWSFIVPSGSPANTVVVERMDIKPGSYKATLSDLDRWERFDPRKPLADQNYNRKLVTDVNGRKSWAYVGASKISAYLTKNGIRVNSGDYLKRY